MAIEEALGPVDEIKIDFQFIMTAVSNKTFQIRTATLRVMRNSQCWCLGFDERLLRLDQTVFFNPVFCWVDVCI